MQLEQTSPVYKFRRCKETVAVPEAVEACRRRAETCFDMNRCAERYLEIFESCRQS